MSMDPLEKERLRQRMATRMGIFLESGNSVSCVSAHVFDTLAFCELCESQHADDLLVVKNRSGKKMKVALSCLKEMVRFRVTDVEDLSRWLEKLKELKADAEKRKMDQQTAREEERKRLERKVIVRKRNGRTGV